jgi:hypothetical protein
LKIYPPLIFLSFFFMKIIIFISNNHRPSGVEKIEHEKNSHGMCYSNKFLFDDREINA